VPGFLLFVVAPHCGLRLAKFLPGRIFTGSVQESGRKNSTMRCEIDAAH
jgi:hypothetical protein